ncbi:MAG: winged helix-turn-helix domain-containing protein [Hyphomicrobiaceae bacterium]|nr:winged helix-turn-helix domain-containing protein [Hyphomicrobiaceae bacterium]
MTHLIVRIDLGDAGRIGPGKMLLLEKIAEHGSISAAGRAMGLPYRHAWELVEQLNRAFREPLVARQTGGRNGGGAALTPFGEALLAEMVGIRMDAERAVSRRLNAIDVALRRSEKDTAEASVRSASGDYRKAPGGKR